jgi:hypothetical protein
MQLELSSIFFFVVLSGAGSGKTDKDHPKGPHCHRASALKKKEREKGLTAAAEPLHFRYR